MSYFYFTKQFSLVWIHYQTSQSTLHHQQYELQHKNVTSVTSLQKAEYLIQVSDCNLHLVQRLVKIYFGQSRW